MYYYDFYTYQSWTFLLIASDKGLVSLTTYEKNDLSHMIHHPFKLTAYIEKLDAYVNHSTQVLDVPYDLKGTDFQLRVWHYLLTIPFGQTTTYEKIAQAIKKPQASRAVGNAVGKNPIMIFIPCHRVIRKSGHIGGFSADMRIKVALLSHEKVKAT